MDIQKFFLGFIMVLACQSASFAQSKAEMGGWYMHSCYRNGQDLAEMNKTLYYAAKNAVAAIDLRDNTLQILDKNAGLNDVGIRCLGCSPTAKMLVICYENSNIDLYDGRTIYNVPDIYKKQMSGNKVINKIFCDDKYAYLASGIGIIVLDLKKKVIKDTWLFKKENQMYEVNDVVVSYDLNDTIIYAATDYGMFYSKHNNPFINNFAAWEQITNVNTPNNSLFRQFAVLDNTIYVLKGDTVASPTDTVVKNVIYVKNNNLWKNADMELGADSSNFDCRFIRAASNRLVAGTNEEIQRYRQNATNGRLEREMTYYWSYSSVTALHASDGKTYIIDENGLRWGGTDEWTSAIVIPGPAQVFATAMDWKKSKLAVVHNSLNNWFSGWNDANVSILRNEEDWTILDRPQSLPYIADFIDVCIAPYDTSIVYVASYVQGLVEMRGDTIHKVYDYTNSTLGIAGDGYATRISRIAFDGYNNLWMTNYEGANPVSVLTKNGDWQSFGIPFAGQNEMGSILVDSRNWIWIAYDKEKKVAIFNPDRSSGTIKNGKWVDLNTSLSEEEGWFDYIYCITETKDGQIWLGTEKGIKIYYNPSRLMSESNIKPQSIPIQVIRNGDTLVELVLGSEMIHCIKADGGNRKWVGTDNAGVFLLSPDGREQIFHFTKDNSPLPSNTVYSIAIDGETGNVYFGTDKGLVSFRYTATDGKENYDNLKIFPNPVRENFDGYISISGLKDHSEVKITDAFGKLVYRTVSNGGTAVWDGRRYDGKKASTGVYFVFVNEDAEAGKEKKAGKILFIK
jgi:hypothetical protein